MIIPVLQNAPYAQVPSGKYGVGDEARQSHDRTAGSPILPFQRHRHLLLRMQSRRSTTSRNARVTPLSQHLFLALCLTD